MSTDPQALPASSPAGGRYSTRAMLANQAEIPRIAEMLRTLLVKNLPQYLQASKDTLSGGDAKQLFFHAHALKNALANLDAPDANALVLQLQKAGTDGDFETAHKLFPPLEAEVLAIMEALKDPNS